MRKQRKQWNSSGFTLVETLCAVSILILFCLMLGTGMQTAMKTYRNVTAASETQLLLNTLVDAIAGELRYAYDTETDGGGNPVYNGGLTLTISGGRVLAGGEELLPKDQDGKGGAYRGGTYQAEDLELKYAPDTGCFTLKLKVVWKDGAICAETPEDGVVIRCLNPPKETEEGGEAP